jgi:hydrogenase-1 operon protein HyaF
MKDFPVPVSFIGPGSQSGEDQLNYMQMPGGMVTFQTPVLPEPEEVCDLLAAREVLTQACHALQHFQEGDSPVCIDLTALDQDNMQLLNQLLGEGEVSASIQADAHHIQIQESVYAGLWRVMSLDRANRVVADHLEIGHVPAAIRDAGQSGLSELVPREENIPGVVNAPAILAEIAEHMLKPGLSHVINLTLMPFTPEDGLYVDRVLGRSKVSLLSRGYGNCRITLTAMSRVWWVQFFNSTDVSILNTIEITDIPEVALAAIEDFRDSAARLLDVVKWIS